MPVQSFTLAEIMPQLLSRLITFTNDKYNETFGLSGMAVENTPQIDPKIAIMGKIYKRPIAGDIPEASEAQLIKDTKFTHEMFTAPEYGQGFAITANDLILNQSYDVNFSKMSVDGSRAPMLYERANSASMLTIDMIKRAEDYQVKQILTTGTLAFDNYTTIDFERDASNSEVITTANLKWKIANVTTMKPLSDFNRWTEQVATRGNSGGQEFIALMESASTYTSMVNSEEWKADSDQRRNYNIQRLQSPGSSGNKNIPQGAMYRYTLIDNPAGPVHIYTYDQTYTNGSGVSTKWLDTGKVYIIATDNVLQRQPVEIMTMDLIAQSTMMRNVLNKMPKMRGWLVTPEWNKTTTRALVMGIYRKFLTLPLTINKTFTATVNS